VSAYYNESDPFAAAWLRNLVDAGAIAPGDVDERDIRDVRPTDLLGYRQCHFFAGIGGWSYAMRLAGWPDERAVWTGSCPCQPFSAAGKGDGFADERHLWPAWFWLIAECRPGRVYGEQIADGGLVWWDLVSTDLEALDYACAAFDIPAAGVQRPQQRQRLFWLADAAGPGWREARIQNAGRRTSGDRQEGQPAGFDAGGVIGQACEWLDGLDGKRRPVEPGTFPLAPGVSGDVGRLRAYGNAIVPEVAAMFISATYYEGM
jgi:DNA (cytosine-5)-methyltransferase 1